MCIHSIIYMNDTHSIKINKNIPARSSGSIAPSLPKSLRRWRLIGFAILVGFLGETWYMGCWWWKFIPNMGRRMPFCFNWWVCHLAHLAHHFVCNNFVLPGEIGCALGMNLFSINQWEDVGHILKWKAGRSLAKDAAHNFKKSVPQLARTTANSRYFVLNF